MALAEMTADVDRVRGFNRFYTRRIGVLDEEHLDSGFTLTEARLLYEVAHDASATAKALRQALGLDAGYVSRLLRRLETAGLLARTADPADRRSAHIALTPRGLALFRRIDRRARVQVGAMLEPLSPADRARLSSAMETIRQVLDGPAAPAPITLRRQGPGDMGWVTTRHGELYARDYGWGGGLEALTARVCADFLEQHDPARERCWIAERDGERLGSVFVVDGGEGVARLRLLLVEPAARGSGLGRRLVAECVAFAREAGYRELVLWTHSILTIARRLYAEACFVLESSAEHDDFGVPVMGETWRLTL